MSLEYIIGFLYENPISITQIYADILTDPSLTNLLWNEVFRKYFILCFPFIFA